jgi:shikimate kinase
MTAARPLVVLIGPPGAGKSSVGPLVADRLGVEFRDTDAEVGAAAGKPVSDIFVEDGEEAFRELERAAVASALAQDSALRAQGGVLALGSGAVLDDGVQHLLAGLPVVYLSASFGTRPPARHAGHAAAGLPASRGRHGGNRRPGPR